MLGEIGEKLSTKFFNTIAILLRMSSNPDLQIQHFIMFLLILVNTHEQIKKQVPI